MKKLIIVLTCLAMVMSFAACDSSTTQSQSSAQPSPSTQLSSPDSSETASATDNSSTAPSATSNASYILSLAENIEPTEYGDIGEYAIRILDCVESVDNNISFLIVSFEYTNNSDEAAAMMDNLVPIVIQDDTILQLLSTSSENGYNLQSISQEAQPGETITVDIALEIVSSSPVTVLVTPILYNGETNITKTFELES